MLITLVFLVTLLGCEEKKKKSLLFSFLAILDGQSGQTVTSSASDTYQVQLTSGNEFTIAPSSPSDSSSSSTSLADQNLTASVEVSTEPTPFKFETIRSYAVNTLVVDINDTLIPNALIGFYEVDPQTGETRLVYQQLTNSEGRIQGTILVRQATEQVEATVSIGNETSLPIPIPLYVIVTRPDGTVVNTPITSITKIIVPISIAPAQQIADRDGDGVPDSLDFYPDDPKKATKLRFPTDGIYTVAYEDLFPSPGDADLNDYVVQMFNEEDLDAKGNIVEIRGYYKHVARGAGYRHTLNLKLPQNASLSFESIIYDSNGNNTNTGKARYTPSAGELSDGIEILGNSSYTIPSPNVDPAVAFQPGHKAIVTIRFEVPISRAALGNSPYDLFVRVLTKPIDSGYPTSAPKATNPALKYYEIHFPNFYFDSQGKDVYIDSTGFPWAILVPKAWAWPLEGNTYDIRGSKSAYPKFKIWMNSHGEQEKEWYLYPNTNYTYPLPNLPF